MVNIIWFIFIGSLVLIGSIFSLFPRSEDSIIEDEPLDVNPPVIKKRNYTKKKKINSVSNHRLVDKSIGEINLDPIITLSDDKLPSLKEIPKEIPKEDPIIINKSKEIPINPKPKFKPKPKSKEIPIKPISKSETVFIEPNSKSDVFNPKPNIKSRHEVSNDEVRKGDNVIKRKYKKSPKKVIVDKTNDDKSIEIVTEKKSSLSFNGDFSVDEVNLVETLSHGNRGYLIQTYNNDVVLNRPIINSNGYNNPDYNKVMLDIKEKYNSNGEFVTYVVWYGKVTKTTLSSKL